MRTEKITNKKIDREDLPPSQVVPSPLPPLKEGRLKRRKLAEKIFPPPFSLQ